MSAAYQRVYNIIREQILNQERFEMNQLPPERVLCDQYGVSRITIRQALKMLQDQGLVERLPGKGTFVKQGKEKKIPILDSNYEMSLNNIIPKMVRDLNACGQVVPPKEISEEFGLLKSEKCLFIERTDVQNGISLSYDQGYIPLSYSASIDESIIHEVDFFSLWVQRENLVLSYNKSAIEAVAATKADVEKLNVPLGSPILLLTDTFFSQEGKIVAIFYTRYRGDKFTLISTEKVKTMNIS